MGLADETMLAYLAGVIDGEGCIAIRRTRRTGSMRSTRYAAVVTVGNTSRLLVERLMAVFNAGCVIYRYPTKTKRACYLWTVQSIVARDVVRMVQPFLVVKDAQAAVLMEFVDHFDSFKGARAGQKGGQVVSASELERRERLYQQMRALNRVGPRADDRKASGNRRSIGITAEFQRARDVVAR